MRLAILAFALGVLVLQNQPVLPPGGAWAGAGLLLLVPLARRQSWPWRALALAGCLAAGFGWAAWRAELRLADELPAAWEGRDVEVVGVVAALPQDFSRGSRFEFDVETILTAGAVVPDRLMLSWYRGPAPGEVGEAEAPPGIRAGERWRFTVRLKKPRGNANPQAFDYEAWLLERGIRATGYVRSRIAAPQRLAPLVWGFAYGVERLRQAVRDRFLAALPEAEFPYAGVLVALAVGDQRAIHGDLWNTFNRTGTTHLMSISGLHVTLVAALFGFLAGAAWRRVPALAGRVAAQRIALAAGVGAGFAYTWLAGFGVPAQRTLYMLAVAGLAMASGRQVGPGRVLALALLAVLAVDPWAVLAAGFWLSFGAVAALLYVGSATVGEAGGWRRHLRQWGVVQWAATLASLPILLLVFQQFSLVSPLANAVAIPVVSFIVTPLALLAAVFPLWPLGEGAHAVQAGLMVFLQWCAQAPVWQAAAPPAWAAAAAAVGVAVLLLPRGVPGRLAGGVLIAPLLAWPAPRPAAGEAWITVLDVGQGLAAVVQTREHILVYDPGPLYSAESDAGQRVVVPYLRVQGVDRLDKLIVTHRDSDHAGGAASVRAAMPVGEFLSSTGEAGSTPCLAGQRWQWDGVGFAVLHPAPADYGAGGKANHLSCVLRVEAGGAAALLTSDIEAPDEAALLARDAAGLKADVVLVPHHGSRTSSTAAFIAATGARQAVIPVGYRNRFGHPKDDVVARYEGAGITLWRTDRDGAVGIRLGPGGAAVAGWRAEHRRYWQGR